MKDILDRELAVGMVCAFNPPKYKGLILCKIERMTPKKVSVSYHDDRYNSTKTTTVYPFELAILDEKDVTMYYLKKKG